MVVVGTWGSAALAREEPSGSLAG